MSEAAARSSEFIRLIAETYRHDFNGYRRDVLGREYPGKLLEEVGESLVKNKRTSVASGHGIGKTGLAADAVHWFISTRPNPAIVATANTEDQLQKKLWRELAKTNSASKNKDWFTWKQTTFTAFEDPTMQAVALAWSENNPDAFAGTHEEHVLGVFDEGSAIPKPIWNTFAGAMTTAGARWLAVGNSTRADGYFYDITHGKLVARKPGDLSHGLWKAFVIASFESPFVDPSWVEEMKRTLGEDSDEYRIRVLGLPPRFDHQQFIAREMVTAAMSRRVKIFNRWPLVLGVDVGHVADRSAIVPRRGRVVLDKIRKITGERTTDFARRVVEEIQYYREEEGLEANCIVEEIGIGVGVVETLQDMGYDGNVWGVNTGNPANEPELYTNLRAEMWALTKEWLEGDVELPNDPDLNDDLCSLRRKPSGSNNKLRLETKDEMRRRGQRSPDIADALALTFAVPFELLPERPTDRYRDYREAGLEPVGSGTSWMAL